MKITSIDALQVFDSRGNPTIEAIVTLDDGTVGRGLVPSGASTGQYEALELRDGGTRFRGQAVYHAIENIHKIIAPALIGQSAQYQSDIDQCMQERDGTVNKCVLGANAILAVSLAVAQARAHALNVPLYRTLGDGRGHLLPLPEIQIIGGGAHANWRTDVQDLLVIAVGAQSYAETLEMTFHVYHAAGELLKMQGHFFGVSDEGGYWPDFETNEQGIAFLVDAIEYAGYEPMRDVAISLDIAASDLFDETEQRYRFGLEHRSFSCSEFAELMIEWCQRYPIISIEDPLADTDWDGWQTFTAAMGQRLQIIGDDLFTTNTDRIQEGIKHNLANAVLIKLNQIGTVTETIEAIERTQSANWLPVISARSGETEDAFISHLAVATNAGQLKVGSFSRSERMAKWNEVLRIERQLGDAAHFAGGNIFQQFLQQSR